MSSKKQKQIIMKKVKFDGKLSLNKETVTKLNDTQMGAVKGGWTGGACFWSLRTCNIENCNCVKTKAIEE